MDLIICDIDGVLADCSHRLRYSKEKNYEAFYAIVNLVEDEPIYDGISLLRNLSKPLDLFDIYLLTGRPERTRKITEMWLKYHGIKFYKMFMRKDGDYRPSPVVKTEIMRELLNDRTKYDQGYSGFFIDDDPENVKVVCKEFPNITGVTFGIKRMEKKS